MVQKCLELSEYIDNFVNNGYESLSFIQDIKSKNELIEIGITKIAHQNRILREIQKLKERDKNHAMKRSSQSEGSDPNETNLEQAARQIDDI